MIVSIHAPNPVCKFVKDIFKKSLDVYSYKDSSLNKLYCEVSKMEFKKADEALVKLNNEVDNSDNKYMKEAFSCIKDQTLKCVRYVSIV